MAVFHWEACSHIQTHRQRLSLKINILTHDRKLLASWIGVANAIFCSVKGDYSGSLLQDSADSFSA